MSHFFQNRGFCRNADWREIWTDRLQKPGGKPHALVGLIGTLMQVFAKKGSQDFKEFPMRTSIRRFLILFLFIAGSAWPQASSSTVRGTVRDVSQAVIPFAKVVLTNTQTNVVRETQTNEAGIYTFPGVIPGTYRIVAEATGMAKFEGAVTVDLQHDVSVDATLVPSSTTTTVNVQDVTPMVTTDSGSVSSLLENQRMNSLPINSRNYQAFLTNTVPNVGSDVSGHIVQYGSRWNSSLTLFDGAVHNETYQAWDFLQPPPLDDIAEMNVQTAVSSAKYESPMTTLLSSKSGTNAFHGDMFETNRNSGYGVARQRQTPSTKPPYLNRNEFGASGGGPVDIPKVYNGRNRTFWFFSWESQRNLSSSSSYYTVPTQAMRNGDFSNLVNANGQQINIYDPFSTDPKTYQRSQFAYNGVPNTINPALESPTAKYLFSITPLPTLPEVNPLIGPNWLGSVPTTVDSDSYSFRLDQRISDRDSIWGRIESEDYNRQYPNGGLPMLNGVANTDHQIAPQKNLEITWLHTFSPTLTNELLVTGSYQHYFRGMGDKKTNYTAMLGLPNAFGTDDWPTINTPLGNYYSENGYWQQNTSYVNVQDNATKMIGKHELQFGFQTLQEYINIQTSGSFNNSDFSTAATSQYDPSSTPTSPLALPLTGYDEANMYLGVGDYASHFVRRPDRYRRRDYSPYIQDNWKVNSRLTLNLGLRWDLRTPVQDAGGTNIGFDLQNQAFVLNITTDQLIRRGLSLPSIINLMQNYGAKFETNQQAGLPASLVYFDLKELGPRLGFAYRLLNGRHPLVMRGGYRISYWAQRLDNWNLNQQSLGPVFGPFQYNRNNAALSPDGLPNYGLRSVPTCIAGVNAANCIDINSPVGIAPGASNFSFMGLDLHATDGRVMDWNFTLEKEVPGDIVARISYVGNYVTDIQTKVHFNDSPNAYVWYGTTQQPLPTGVYANTATRVLNQTPYGGITFWEPIGFSHHNRFTFEIERRFHQGLALQAFYVVGKTMLVNEESNYNNATVQTVNTYLPGTVPMDVAARLKFLNYKLDSAEPLHTMHWNFVLDLPFGKGKKIAGNAHGLVDTLIGGWRLAGIGSWYSTRWTLPTSYYPNGTPVQTYGYKHPIQDCTSGICKPGYLWWNGYINPTQINRVDASGRCTGICGVPADYKPAGGYLIPWGSTAVPANTPAGTNLSTYWDTNTVWIPLNNGTVQRTTFNNNMHPWNNQYFSGPIQWFQDASLQKWFSFHEKARLRFSLDFFNVLNNPNNPTGVGGNGVLGTNTSGSAARIAQMGLRLEW
jgi:hypothetical protein